MSEKESLDKTSELYKKFPFMESFPFEEYTITLEQEGIDPEELGISPILLKMLGSFGTDNYFNFSYLKGEKAFSIAFHQEDILEIAERAKTIKKLNSVVEDLVQGIKEKSISEKLLQVKKSKKFIKSLGLENLLFVPMTEVLSEILELHKVVLTSDQLLGIQKLNLEKIAEEKMVKKQKEAVLDFFNFQLNYAKVILGIVIAAKIH